MHARKPSPRVDVYLFLNWGLDDLEKMKVYPYQDSKKTSQYTGWWIRNVLKMKVYPYQDSKKTSQYTGWWIRNILKMEVYHYQDSKKTSQYKGRWIRNLLKTSLPLPGRIACHTFVEFFMHLIKNYDLNK